MRKKEEMIINLIGEQFEGDKFIIPSQVDRLWLDSMDRIEKMEKSLRLLYGMVDSGLLQVRNCEGLAFELKNYK